MKRFLLSWGTFFSLAFSMAQPCLGNDAVPQKKPLLIFVLGAPGAGPSDLAGHTAQTYKLTLISPALLLQFYLNEEGALGDEVRESFNSHGLVTDALLIKMLSGFVQQNPNNCGYVLEAFPRTFDQTKALFENFRDHFRIMVFSINLSDEVLIDRYVGRVVCPNCGRVYHTETSPPEETGVCDLCGQALVVRSEDEPEKVRGRVKEYHTRVTPIIEYAKTQKALFEIDSNKYVGVHFLEGCLKEMNGIIDHELEENPS
jgi:adenylate kinase